MMDVLYRVQVVARVLEGIEDADAGRTISTEELLQQVDRWASRPIRRPGGAGDNCGF